MVKLEQDEEEALRRDAIKKIINKKIQKFQELSVTKTMHVEDNEKPLVNVAPSAEKHPKMCRLLFLCKGAHPP